MLTTDNSYVLAAAILQELFTVKGTVFFFAASISCVSKLLSFPIVQLKRCVFVSMGVTIQAYGGGFAQL